MTRWLKHERDGRQLLIVGAYLTLLAGPFFFEALRNPLVLVAACAMSFCTMTVNHNVMHAGLFKSRAANHVFRCVLSFCALFPVSSVIPSHNLVHHHFDDDGQPDWAESSNVRFKWNLLNLLHFPNVAGPITFNGISRWAALKGRAEYRRQSAIESVVAFGLTGALLAYDFWTALFFVMIPQLWGARWFLRINIIQHDGADTSTEWNHSRNFTGRVLNWFIVNAGYHTIHHNRAGMHWTALPAAHQKECAARIHPSLVEPSMLGYLARTYLFTFARPKPVDLKHVEAEAPPAKLAPRTERLAEAELASAAV